MGTTYFFLEEYDQALESFLSIKSQNQGYIQYWLGLCYFMKEDYIKAREHLDSAIYLGVEVDPSLMETLKST